jgi:hypothetical protein
MSCTVKGTTTTSVLFSFSFLICFLIMVALIEIFPDALLAKIFQEFLDCSDLTELDSALCSKSVRNVFLDIISNDTCVMSNESFSSNSFLNWLSSRSIFVKHLFIEDATQLVQIQLSWRKVEMLEFLNFEDHTLSSTIINQCESLVSVTMLSLENEDMQTYGDGLLSEIDVSIWDHLKLLMFITTKGPMHEEYFTTDLTNFSFIRIKIDKGHSFDDVVYILFQSAKFPLKDIISNIGMQYQTSKEIHFEACGVLFDLLELMIFIKDHRETNVVSVVSSLDNDDEDDNNIVFQFERKSSISLIRMKFSEQVLTTDIEIVKQAMSVPLGVGSIKLDISGYNMVALKEIQNLFYKTNPGYAV